MNGLHGWHEHVPAGAAAGLIIVHGIAEHASRYHHIAPALAQHGIACFAYDQRGHGRHPGTRTDIEDFAHFAADLENLGQALRRRFAALPLFVWGHSMGSVIVTLAAIEHLRWARGIITTGHALHALPKLDGVRGAAIKLAARLAPRLRVGLRIDGTQLTQVVEAQRAHMADPLVPRTASLRLLFGFAAACATCAQSLPAIRQPWLAVHGEADTVCPPRGSRIVVAQLGSTDKTLVTYPGLLHEVHNENETARTVFFNCMSQWILARSGSSEQLFPHSETG
jgi:alpha-beta hydrolase superfamily lysophospholipase